MAIEQRQGAEEAPTSMSPGTRSVVIAAQAHLGGNFAEGDPVSHAPAVWNYVIDRFGIASVLDLGCGIGHASVYFYRRGMKVVAVDGLDFNVRHSLYPAVKIDLTNQAVSCFVDLVHCQEVVEHIEEKHINNVLDSLCCGKLILMTHALPGQAGHHHVNLQPPEYWISRMKERKCNLLPLDTKRIRELAQAEGAHYFANSALLFANSSRI